MPHSSSGSSISVDSAAMQALWSKGTKLESPTYSYYVSAGHYQCYDKLKAIYPLVLICVQTNCPGSWFATAVLGCRSLLLVIIQPSTK